MADVLNGIDVTAIPAEHPMVALAADTLERLRHNSAEEMEYCRKRLTLLGLVLVIHDEDAEDAELGRDLMDAAVTDAVDIERVRGLVSASRDAMLRWL